MAEIVSLEILFWNRQTEIITNRLIKLQWKRIYFGWRNPVFVTEMNKLINKMLLLSNQLN